MDETIPADYKVEGLSSTLVSLRSSSEDALFTVEPIRDNIFRVTFTSHTHPLPPHPSIPRPQPLFTLPPTLKRADEQLLFETHPNIRLTIRPNPTPVITVELEGRQLYSDLPYRSYVFDGTGASRYGCFDPTTLHLGLGERAAPFDLSNRTFSLSALDAAEYDVYRTDPLYKHIPFLIRASQKGCVGVVSTSHSRGTWSVGGEIDALWGRYEVMRQNWGGLEVYLIVADSLRELVQSYALLVGYPKMIPRWSLGYLASSMGYAESDDPPAQQLLERFPELCKQHDIPCSAMHLSSGYIVSMVPPKTRNVFTLNTHRFPDAPRLFKTLSEAGIRTIANIKPYILETHPAYKLLAEKGAFFKTEEGTVSVTRVWSAGLGESGRGSWLDMTSSAAQEWWYEGVRGLLNMGIEGIWNDNNEFGLPSDKLLCAGDSSDEEGGTVGLYGRAANTEIMAQTSFQAISDANSTKRPYLLTRSATIGTLRYANSSWSGDNYTSWETLRGNNAMGLTAGLCLLQSYGHDCGGFTGPKPSPELFLRWVQLATLAPRFTIHSWKPTKEDPSSVSNITEPWMYPSVLSQIREAIKRRYELIPYLYELSFRSAEEAQPLQRWTGWDVYAQDPNVWNNKLLRSGETQYFLGDALLVGGVYEENVNETEIYLPRCKDDAIYRENTREKYYDHGFISLHFPYSYYSSGQWVTVPTPVSNIAVLARVGSVIPVGKPCVTTSQIAIDSHLTKDTWRGVEIYPPPLSTRIEGCVYEGGWREDDGVSLDSGVSEFHIRYKPEHDKIKLEARCISKEFKVLWNFKIWVILPVGEKRPVFAMDVKGIYVERESSTDKNGRLGSSVSVITQ